MISFVLSVHLLEINNSKTITSIDLKFGGPVLRGVHTDYAEFGEI